MGRIKNGGTITNTTAVNCKVETSGFSAGVGVGFNDAGSVANTYAENCTLKTSGELARAGIGAGFNKGTVTNTKAVNCT